MDRQSDRRKTTCTANQKIQINELQLASSYINGTACHDADHRGPKLVSTRVKEDGPQIRSMRVKPSCTSDRCTTKRTTIHTDTYRGQPQRRWIHIDKDRKSDQMAPHITSARNLCGRTSKNYSSNRRMANRIADQMDTYRRRQQPIRMRVGDDRNSDGHISKWPATHSDAYQR